MANHKPQTSAAIYDAHVDLPLEDYDLLIEKIGGVNAVKSWKSSSKYFQDIKENK